MANDKRRRIKIMERTFTADGTDLTSTGTAVVFNIENMAPPYMLEVLTTDAGTAPVTSLSFEVQVQTGPDGTNFVDKSGFINTAITAAGTQYATDDLATSLGSHVRAHADVAAGTWNDGTKIEAWLYGIIG